MGRMRVWVATAIDSKGEFREQRRIEAPGRDAAEKYAFAWFKSVGGDLLRSKLEEVT